MQAERKNRPTYVQRPARLPVTADVTVADDCGRQLEARLSNVSDGGFMAECEQRLPIGARIMVDLPDRGTVSAEIRWVLGWRFGAQIVEDPVAAG